ncbi:CRISPR-associated protein Csx3 [Aphanothece hegewaldii CCALA 016]|uniref:CRISPR-associated protein Csx3 n=1 Tax=Aphanothece hegewaldii CCALA 016 TaxID=2107694 RepID=A0A2T1LYB6_9CHRO|nr:CRISPR-associated protein Csx3 [Aphanothece hegewaldii]PSF37379.1 CRISPR-associated protein Csx3 [Aphanothece hegewaldii CCALA 016]
MTTKSQVQLEIIQLQGNNNIYQTLAINLLQPQSLITVEEMLTLEIPQELDRTQGIILYGSAPIWLYTYLIERLSSYPWLACFDLRSQSAIVVSSQISSLTVGDSIPIQFTTIPNIAIIIGGPPNSGKSVFANALRKDLAKYNFNAKVYLHRANWDGEGNHTYETAEELAETLKQRNKNKIHLKPNAEKLLPEYFNYHAKAIANIRQVIDITLVDVGGKADIAKNPVIEQCTHYIIISSDPEEIQEWHNLFSEKLQPLAVIHSVLENKIEILKTEPFLEIVAGKWERNHVTRIPEVLLKEILECSCNEIC